MEELRTGATYIRVSTDGQMDLSPESQLESIQQYAAEHNIIIPKEYIFMESEGRSGKKADNRPQFQAMIATAKLKPKPFDCVLVWKFSRFARNLDESTFYKGVLRKKLGIDVISIKEPIMEGMYGRLIEMIIEWQDEFYSYNLAQDVTRGMKTAAKNGRYQARPPLGYRIPYHKALPEIVPEEAEIVRMIFDKYVNEGMSIFALARYLNSLGFKTSRGKPFEKRSLEYILQNPAYTGQIRWNRTCNETNEVRDPDQWIIAQGQHPAIISTDLYDRAQARFQAEYHPKKARPAETLKHWLSGIVKCPACGRTLSSCIRHRKSGEDFFSFQCYGYMKGKCNQTSYVREDTIVPAVISALKEVVECGSVEYVIRTPEKKKEENFQVEALKKQLERLDRREIRIKEAYMDGIDTKEEYRQNKQMIQEERQRIENALSALSFERPISKASADRQMLINIRNVIDILENPDVATDEKAHAIRSIVSHIVFFRDTMHIDVYYQLTCPVSDSDTAKSRIIPIKS